MLESRKLGHIIIIIIIIIIKRRFRNFTYMHSTISKATT